MSNLVVPDGFILDGPWVDAFFFEVPIAIRSKSNFRRAGGSKEWKAFSKFEEDVSFLARRAVPESWPVGDLGVPLSKRPVVVNFIYARSALDTANLSKSVLDACEGVVFQTDASVRACAAVSTRSSKASWGVAAFAVLDSDASVKDINAALSVLSEQTLTLLP